MMPFQQPMQLGFGSKSSGGRPSKPQQLILHAPGDPEGLNGNLINPAVIKQANDLYMNGGKNEGLPSGLTPKRLSNPQAIEGRRGRAISKGWGKRGKA